MARARQDPYAAKRALAADLVTQFHGPEKAAAAERFDTKLSAILRDIGFAKSASEARRMIEQGGVQVNGAKPANLDLELAAGACVVKYGKLKFADVTVR